MGSGLVLRVVWIEGGTRVEGRCSMVKGGNDTEKFIVVGFISMVVVYNEVDKFIFMLIDFTFIMRLEGAISGPGEDVQVEL